MRQKSIVVTKCVHTTVYKKQKEVCLVSSIFHAEYRASTSFGLSKRISKIKSTCIKVRI